MTKAVAPHQEHAVLCCLLRTYGKGITGHHFAYSSSACFTSFHHRSLHEIPLGKNSHQQAVAKYGYRADIARDHGLRHVQHCLIRVCSVSLLVFDKVTNMHTSPLEPAAHEGEYKTKPGKGEESNCCPNRGGTALACKITRFHRDRKGPKS